MDITEYLDSYLSDLKKVLNSLNSDQIRIIYEKLSEVRMRGDMVFVMGNGGSAATSSHFICDMGKNTRNITNPRLRIVGLSDNVAIFSAYANDEGYENSFKEQILTLGKEGDLLIAISGSGNSKNLLNAVRAAKTKDILTISITGCKGGKLKELVDHYIIIPSDDMEIIEDIHLVINHLLTGLLRGSRYIKIN